MSSQPKTARNSHQLRNLDGSTMGVQDFLSMVRKLLKDLEANSKIPPAIMDFGY